MNKKIVVMILTLIIMTINGVSAAAPSMEIVITTPLYANENNVLTCRYFASDPDNSSSELTPLYQWYDGKDGVFYNGGSTYTDTENGFIYYCRVLVNDGSLNSSLVNSLNNVTISASCINPYPFILEIENQTNITELPEGRYFHLGNITVSTIKATVDNYSYLFYGGIYGENGSEISVPGWYQYYLSRNLIYLTNTVGEFITNGNENDKNFATYYERSGASKIANYSLNINYSHYLPYPPYTNFRIKTGCKGNGVSSGSVYIYGLNSSGEWELFHKCYTIGAVEHIEDALNISTKPYYDFKLKMGSIAGGFSRIYELWPINYTYSGNVTGSGSNRNLSLTDFSQGEGSLYNWDYIDEETGSPINLSTGTVVNKTELIIRCSTGETTINISDDPLGSNYSLGLKELPEKIDTLITYDDASDYFRRMFFCDRYSLFNWPLIEAVINSPMIIQFTIIDESSSSKWEAGGMRLNRMISGTNTIINADQWAADNTISSYLIPNRDYQINLFTASCGEINNIGWITTIAGDNTKTITITGTDYNLTHRIGFYENVTFLIAFNNSDICFYYTDLGNETDWVYWAVVNYSDNNIVYSDNQTVSLYTGCYANPPPEDNYFVNVIFSHPDGSTLNITQGTLNKTVSGPVNITLSGNAYLGMQAPTFNIFISLLIIFVTGFLLGALHVGAGGLLVVAETIFFSAIGWLPLFDGSPEGWFIIILMLILAGLGLYTSKRA